mgnify:CR=1 FL=1
MTINNLITNQVLDLETAEEINKLFYEVLIAPDFSVEALDLLKTKSKRVLLKQKNTHNGKPKAIIASTLKGRGVPGLQDAPLSHIINPKPELIKELIEKINENFLDCLSIKSDSILFTACI